MPEAPSALVVYEHITGGGVRAGRPLPPWWGEARAVLVAVAGLFRTWGRLPVVTTTDERLAHDGPAADEVVTVTPGEGPAALASLATRCGAALVIAPETGGTLARVTAQVEQTGALVLGSPATAVAAAADKLALWRRLQAAGLPAPAARPAADVTQAREAAGLLGYPVVVKPRLGASCEGVARVDDPAGLDRAVAGALRYGAGPVVVQRLVEGMPASVTLLAAGGRAAALSLNGQDVALGATSAYRGGIAGIDHPRRERAFAVAREVVRLVPGLRGFVGVDLVIGDGGCSVLEVNPRVTTPVLGLARALRLDLAEALWRACVDAALPAEPVPAGDPAPFPVEVRGGV